MASSSSSFISSPPSATCLNTIPPRRGQIKARIFKSLIKKVTKTVLIRRVTPPMASQDPKSAIPTTPPSSSYNSDG